MPEIDLLKTLNTGQKAAVTHSDGPLLIVAGAGTGKTTVLINRLAYLVLEKKIPADSLLLLTFTEKAATELEERADRILPYGYTDLWISTFHGFGEKILRDYGLEIGLNPSFRLLSQTEQWILIKKNLDKFNLDYYRPLGNPSKFISELIHHFSRLKDENISPADYLTYAIGLQVSDDMDGMEISRIKELAGAFNTYNQILLDEGLLDFGDLIVYLLKLFKERPNILEFYRRKFTYVMVDEFQDTNLAQYELVRLLAAPRNNLVVVGDDNQAIYKFRGASLSNILQFKDDYPNAEEIVLNDNYRSRQEILDRAYEFIKHNDPNTLEYKLKINKSLKAKNPEWTGETNQAIVSFSNFRDAEAEVSFVAEKIKELIINEPNVNFSDFAILVRANDTAEAYVKELNRQEIPNQFMSWRGLYYKPIILDILAYFRLLDDYHESSALFRVLNIEPFKVSHAEIIELNKLANRKAWSLYEALQNADKIKTISGESLAHIKHLLEMIKEHSTLSAKSLPSHIYLRFAYDSGFLKSLDYDRDLEIFSQLNQLYQKMRKMEEAEADLKLKDFLAAINLELEAGETGSLKLDFLDNDCVKIMTVHGAKGLEFRYVFLVNLVDKKFPTIARSEKIAIPDALVKEVLPESGDFHLEEERRLFYVAMTRAKDRLFLTGAKDYGGAREKKPSRFIAETGVKDINEVEIALSKKNEFLRDLHYLNSRDVIISDEKTAAEKYPLPAKFSFSQLAAFSTCPLQYKFAFVLKIPATSDKSSLIFGRVLHNTLYNFLLPFMSGRASKQGELFAAPEHNNDLLNEKRLLELYDEMWQDDGYRSKKDREEYRLKGKKALQDFFAAFMSDRPAEIIFLEKNFTFKIAGDIIKGTIDRVDRLSDGSLEVVDYKTGQGKEKLEFKDKRQLILYQLFLEEFLGQKVSCLSYYFLETGKKLSFVAKESDITKLRLEIMQEIAAIKNRDFSPSPSLMCRYCDFNKICEHSQA